MSEQQETKVPPPPPPEVAEEIVPGRPRSGSRDDIGAVTTLISTVLVGVGGVYATTQSAWVTAMATAAAAAIAVIAVIYLVRRPGGRR